MLSHQPAAELYGLTSQIRRAVTSLPANIAEAFGRYHYMDRITFLLNARASLNELKSHLLIAEELGFVDTSKAPLLSDARGLIEALSVTLNNFIRAMRRSTDAS